MFLRSLSKYFTITVGKNSNSQTEFYLSSLHCPLAQLLRNNTPEEVMESHRRPLAAVFSSMMYTLWEDCQVIGYLAGLVILT